MIDFNVEKSLCRTKAIFVKSCSETQKFDSTLFYKASRNLSFNDLIFKLLQKHSQENLKNSVENRQNYEFDDDVEDDDFNDLFQDRSHHLPHHHNHSHHLVNFLLNLFSFLETRFATMLTICSKEK